jgi:hypothetical protein
MPRDVWNVISVDDCSSVEDIVMERTAGFVQYLVRFVSPPPLVNSSVAKFNDIEICQTKQKYFMTTKQISANHTQTTNEPLKEIHSRNQSSRHIKSISPYDSMLLGRG